MTIHTKALFILLPIVLSTTSSHSQANYLQEALAADNSGPQYSYDIEYRLNDLTAFATVDPRQEVGKRITVHQPPAQSWDAEFRAGVEEMEKEAEDKFWCATLNETIPPDAILTNENAETATYQFDPVADAGDDEDARFKQNLVGQVTVTKDNPQIVFFSLSATQPFKPVWIAEIRRFELRINCERTPDGRTRIRQFSLEVDGSAAFQKISERESRFITNVTQLP